MSCVNLFSGFSVVIRGGPGLWADADFVISRVQRPENSPQWHRTITSTALAAHGWLRQAESIGQFLVGTRS